MNLSRKALKLIYARIKTFFLEYYFPIVTGILGVNLILFFMYALLTGDSDMLTIAGEIWIVVMTLIILAASVPVLSHSISKWRILALFPLDFYPSPKAALAYVNALQYGMEHGSDNKAGVLFWIPSAHSEVRMMQFFTEDIISPDNIEVFHKYQQTANISDIGRKEYVLLNALLIGISNHVPTQEQIDLFDKNYDRICEKTRSERIIVGLKA